MPPQRLDRFPTADVRLRRALGHIDQVYVPYVGATQDINLGTHSVLTTGIVTASRLVLTVAIGTAPLTVTSTTIVTNLNADLLDGAHAPTYTLPLSVTGGVSPVVSLAGLTTLGTATYLVRVNAAGTGWEYLNPATFLSGYVPYTGATGTVNLGAQALITTGLVTAPFKVSSATGVSLSATNGVLTIAGLKTAGNNESLTIDFETTANKIAFGSGTGVTDFTFGGINLTTTGLARINNVEAGDGIGATFTGTYPIEARYYYQGNGFIGMLLQSKDPTGAGGFVLMNDTAKYGFFYMYGSTFALSAFRNAFAISNKDGTDIYFGFGNFTPQVRIINGGGVDFYANYLLTTGGINSAATQTTVNGSVAGTAIFSQPFQGTSYKKCIAYAIALNGVAAYTFPTAFVKTPHVYGDAAGIAVTTTTTLTLTGAVTTGNIFVEGY